MEGVEALESLSQYDFRYIRECLLIYGHRIEIRGNDSEQEAEERCSRIVEVIDSIIAYSEQLARKIEKT